MAKATGRNHDKGDEKPPKYLYRYIPFERLAEILMRREIPIPRPQDWNDQHDLRNSIRGADADDVVGIACFTSKCGTCFHWDLFAKYGVRLAFDKKKLKERVEHAEAKLQKVNYCSNDEYIDALNNGKPLLFVKRNQYKPEREWRITCQISKEKMATENVVKFIPFEWGDLKKITISPHYSISDYYFYKAMILNMLESVGAKNVQVLRSPLFESKKIKNAEAELDLEEDEK